MRFRGEVQDRVGLKRLQQLVEPLAVGDIGALEAVARVVLDRPQRGEIGRIGQLVEIEHARANSATNSRHTADPINPAPPVTRIFITTPWAYDPVAPARF